MEFIQEILSLKFEKRKDLVKKIKELAIKHNFKIFIPYGEKVNKLGVKKTEFSCSLKLVLKDEEYLACPFFLEFLTDDFGKYYLSNYCNEHNHAINLISKKDQLNTPIKDIIKSHGTNFASTQKLVDHLNKEYNLQATYHQIYYQQSKIHIDIYGQIEEDAENLFKLIKERSNLGLCKYDFQVNENNELITLLYFSNNMETLFASLS